MQQEDIKQLLQNDKSALSFNGIADDLLKSFDGLILSCANEISEDVYNVYKKFAPMKREAPSGMKKELFKAVRNFIKEKISKGLYPDALLLFRFLIVKLELDTQSYIDIAQVLTHLGKTEFSLYFLNCYEKKETNKPLKYLTLANFYNLELKDYKTAISYYEKYIKIDETKSVIYTILASLYSKVWGDISLNDQIFYFEKAYKLKPADRLILHGLAFAYERAGNKEECGRFYKKLLDNNPTDTDYYNYGAFLISCGDFEKGHKYFTHRFSIDDINLKYPLDDISKKWDMHSDISGKTLLVHYEQGFGDTFMYCRFVPYLKKFAEKIIFVVQDNLFELVKSSKLISEGIDIVSDKTPLENLDWDYSMALLDTPYVLGISSDDIPMSCGYLEAERDLIEAYKKKYIKPSQNIKAAISYSGDKAANYNGRDIDISKFNNLFRLDGIDFYSLQVESDEKETGKVISLGKTFNNFTDTACAVKNMDVVITTDNVILNLAGALGVKTFALFNFYTNFRWFKLEGSDTGWYKSVKPFHAQENNRWSHVFSKVYNELEEILKN